MMYATACGAHWSDWLYEIDVEMNIGFVVFEHFDNLKVWQIKQFRDSLELHRVSPLCHGSVGKQNLNKVG
jgi:phosphatidylglycerophosphatase A